MKVYLIHRRKINDINIRMIRLKIEKAIKEGNLVGIYGEGIENFRKAKFAKNNDIFFFEVAANYGLEVGTSKFYYKGDAENPQNNFIAKFKQKNPTATVQENVDTDGSIMSVRINASEVKFKTIDDLNKDYAFVFEKLSKYVPAHHLTVMDAVLAGVFLGLAIPSVTPNFVLGSTFAVDLVDSIKKNPNKELLDIFEYACSLSSTVINLVINTNSAVIAKDFYEAQINKLRSSNVRQVEKFVIVTSAIAAIASAILATIPSYNLMKTKVTNLAIKFTEEGINILKSKGAKQSFIWDGTGFNFVLAMRGSNNFFNKVILPRTPYGRKITGAARLVREQILAALNEKLTENKINTKDLYQLSQSNLSRVTDASLYAQRAVMALFSTITAVYCIAYYFNAMGAMEEFTDNSGFNSVTSVFSALVRVFLLVFMTYNLVNLIFNTLREKIIKSGVENKNSVLNLLSNIALVTIATLSLSGPSQLVKEYFLSYFMEGGLGINLTALSISFFAAFGGNLSDFNTVTKKVINKFKHHECPKDRNEFILLLMSRVSEMDDQAVVNRFTLPQIQRDIEAVTPIVAVNTGVVDLSGLKNNLSTKYQRVPSKELHDLIDTVSQIDEFTAGRELQVYAAFLNKEKEPQSVANNSARIPLLASKSRSTDTGYESYGATDHHHDGGSNVYLSSLD